MHVHCVLQEMMHDEEDAASAGGKPRPQDRVRQWLGLGGRRKAEIAQGAVDPSNPESVKVGCQAHSQQGQWAVLRWHPYTAQQGAQGSVHVSFADHGIPEAATLIGCVGLLDPIAIRAPRALQGACWAGRHAGVLSCRPCLVSGKAWLPVAEHWVTAAGLLGLTGMHIHSSEA